MELSKGHEFRLAGEDTGMKTKAWYAKAPFSSSFAKASWGRSARTKC